jgi:hypothetical protein
MNGFRYTLKALAVLFFTLTVTSFAEAQATRTWVSGVGDDANPCSRTAPCKTFAGAISKTAAGGEISALDPAGFGAINITKSITINGDGTLAGILASLVNGVIVNAGANDVVTLRNISINGAGNGVNGIRYLAGKALRVDNCSISGFTGHGIDTSLVANGQLIVTNTNITQCGGDGIRLTQATAGQFVTASIDHVRIDKCNNGVESVDRSRVTISNSVIVLNAAAGVLTSGAGDAIVNVVSSQVSHNIDAFKASAGATIRISNNYATNNTTGINQNGGTITSFGDNQIVGNGADGTATGAFVTKK